jgi:secreted trypsin-like serine protease
LLLSWSPIDKIQPVRLPSRSEAIVNSDNFNRLQLAAWGIYSNAQQTSHSLLFADVQMLSTAECMQLFGASFITEAVVCSKPIHCLGDSGSVLINRGDDGEDFLAVGIASFANYETCAVGENHASAYMRVASYLDFIDSHTNLITD